MLRIIDKPKGLHVIAFYHPETQTRPRKFSHFEGRFKTKGRTGARGRFLFSQLDNDKRQAILHKWARGN